MASNKRKLPVTDNDPDSTVTVYIGTNYTPNVRMQKLVELAATSEFFESILKDLSYNTITIKPPKDINMKCLRTVWYAVVDSTSARIDIRDSKEVFRIAQFLDLRSPIDWVRDSIKDSLCRENAYELWNAVADSGMQHLEDLAVNKLRSSFGYFATTVEFQQCSVKQLACITAGGPLEIESELQLLKTIVAWCQANRDTRWNNDSLSCLLQEIRWELIPADVVEMFLVVAEEPLPHIVKQLVQQCLPPFSDNTARLPKASGPANCNVPSPLRHVQEVVIFLTDLTFQCYRWQNSSIVSRRARTRKLSQGVEHWMICVGGKIWLSTNKQQVAVLEPSNWELDIGEMPHLPSHPELRPLVCGGLVYIMANDSFVTLTVRVDPGFARLLVQKLPLPHVAGMVTGWDVWNTDLYLCGEVQAERSEPVKTEDNVDPTLNRVCIVSGRSGKSSERKNCKLDRMCRFSTITKMWTDCAPMKMARRELSITSHNWSIYATGGRWDVDMHSTTRTCERYDIASNTWHTIADLTIRRRRHCSFVLNNRLHVAGGVSELSTPVTQMEMYDEERDRWEIVVLDAQHAQPVCPLACVVVRTNGFS